MGIIKSRLIGNIFNYKYSYVSNKSFKVLYDIGKVKNGCRKYCCQCTNCKKEFEAISSNIKSGSVKVCSCINKMNL